jgi:hypothetical protein
MGTLLKKKSIFISIVLSLYSLIQGKIPVEAKKTIGDAGTALESVVAPTGLPKNSVAGYIGVVSTWIFGILGIVFFGLMVYAGIVWFIARGDETKITEARNTMIATVVGLIVMTSAFAIATFVSSAVGLD